MVIDLSRLVLQKGDDRDVRIFRPPITAMRQGQIVCLLSSFCYLS